MSIFSLMNRQKPSKEEEKRNRYIRFLGVASMVGVNFVATTFVGFAIGHWIVDPFFNTDPWFAIIFMFLGIAAGFKYLFKLLKRAGEFDKEDEKNRIEM